MSPDASSQTGRGVDWVYIYTHKKLQDTMQQDECVTVCVCVCVCVCVSNDTHVFWRDVARILETGQSPWLHTKVTNRVSKHLSTVAFTHVVFSQREMANYCVCGQALYKVSFDECLCFGGASMFNTPLSFTNTGLARVLTSLHHKLFLAYMYTLYSYTM